MLRRRSLLLAAAAMTATPPARAAAQDWVMAWDSQGDHRTATQGDDAGAAWLAAEARAMGATVEIETFPIARYDPVAAFVELEGVRYGGVPMFDARDTPDGRIHALAGRFATTEAHVGVGDISPFDVYKPDFLAQRRAAKHQAVVLATRGGAPGLALLNAEHFTAPFGPAILLVPSETGDLLAPAVARGAALRVVVRSTRTATQARNVVVTIKGANPALPPLVVMTPRSSWWASTAERAGGLVCWLECLRALRAARPARDVILTANTGHELGHIGLDAFIARRTLPPETTWLHFGANIGAARGALSVVSGHDDLRARMSAALADTGVPHGRAPAGTVPNGETRDIARAGGRYITLVGSNPLFHLPQDRFPHAVELPAIERGAAAAARVAVELAV